MGAQGVPLSAALRAPYGPQGWDPSGNARLRLGSFEARIQADAHLQGGALAWRDGLHHLGLRLQHRGALLQGGPELGWQLPGPVAGWELGYRGLFDLQDRDSLSQQARLGWRSACDCLSARLGATWSADRRVPDLGLQVELR